MDSGLWPVGVEQQQGFRVQNSAFFVPRSTFRVLPRFVIRASSFVIFYFILHPSSFILFLTVQQPGSYQRVAPVLEPVGHSPKRFRQGGHFRFYLLRQNRPGSRTGATH
jgi:hypothetical protein